MHIIQILRSYLGITQQELAQKAGISQPDLCEMEIKTPYGRIDKYQRLSDYLGISVHALVTNDCRLVPSSFFERHPPRTYTEKGGTANMELGRSGEDAVFDLERHRLAQINTSLASLVLPFYKLRHRPGYDILSFDESGVPIFIEVKTTTDDNPDFALTKQEYLTACKLTKAGEVYRIYRYTSWGRKNQALNIFDFAQLQDGRQIYPTTYLCSTSSPNKAVSGISYCREKAGMSKGELADRIGIQTMHLWRYENGKQQCSVGLYQKIANVLDVTIDQLLVTYT